MTNFIPKPKKRIAVAMSGGVDSSAAAVMLAKEGHEILGLTAWTLNGPGKCCNDALVNAGRVCEMLGVPYDTVDLRAEFAHFVLEYYNNSYEAGLTPNPCVECNQHVKWDLLVRYAVEELDVDYVATGHYARIQHDKHGVHLLRGKDARKDQTYMMARVYQKDLERALFPLGDWIKPDVVKYAQEHNVPNADSAESQDICFVLDGQANYMKQTFGERKGNIVDYDTGKNLGEHEGYFKYTLGQRKGVKVAAGRPIYVVKIDPKENIVYVGDKIHLERTDFTVKDTHWIQSPFKKASATSFESMVKIRYNTPPEMATVTKDNRDASLLHVKFHKPVSAITPGQITAFYDPTDTEIWGGGYVETHLNQGKFDPESKKELPNLYCDLPSGVS